MPNPTYPDRIADADELVDVVLKRHGVVLVYQQDTFPAFRRLELGDERPTYAYSRSDGCFVRVNVMRAKDV